MCGVHWDKSVPQSLYTEWPEFVRQLELMNQVSLNRKLLIKDYCDIQFHGFCNANNVDLSACLYIRSMTNTET